MTTADGVHTRTCSLCEAMCGLLITVQDGRVAKIRPNPDGIMHDSRDGRDGRLYKRKVRHWDAAAHGKPVVHSSVFQRTKDRHNIDAAYEPWILNMDVDEWAESI